MDLDKVTAWLESWSGWQEGAKLYVDYTDGIPGNCGLFPKGLEEVEKKADVLGNVTARCRFRFTLCRVTEHTEDGTECARWAQQLQQWVQAQSAAGLVPAFGDVPEKESVRAEKGRLHRLRQTGNVMYAVEFTAEFMKIYEVIE